MRYSSLLLILLYLSSCQTINQGVIYYDHSSLLIDKKNNDQQTDVKDSLFYSIIDSIVSKKRSVQSDDVYDVAYFFNEKQVRVRNKHGIPDSLKYHLFDIEKNRSIVYKLNRKKLRVDTIQYDWRVNPDWEVSYKILDHKANAKNILGFDCDFYRIDEFKKTALSKTHFRYEIFATKRINFPTNLTSLMYQSIDLGCPLFISIKDMNHPKYYSQIIARKFDQIDPSAKMILPNKFKDEDQ